MKLTATYRKVGDLIVVYCRGRIIFGDEVEGLAEDVRNQARSRIHRAVVHLGGVEGLRPGDLGTLWLAYMAAKASGWQIRFCSLPNELTYLLKRTATDGAFEIYDDEERAVASFGEAYLAVPSLSEDVLSPKVA